MNRKKTAKFIQTSFKTDKSTQIDKNDTWLFNFETEVEPILEVLVARAVNQAHAELEEEEKSRLLTERIRNIQMKHNIKRLFSTKHEYKIDRYAKEIQLRKAEKQGYLHKVKSVHQKIYSREYVKRLKVNDYFQDVLDKLYIKRSLKTDQTLKIENSFIKTNNLAVTKAIEKKKVLSQLLQKICNQAKESLSDLHSKTIRFNKTTREQNKQKNQNLQIKKQLAHKIKQQKHKIELERSRKLQIFQDMEKVLKSSQPLTQEDFFKINVHGFWDMIKFAQNPASVPRRKSKLMHSDLFGLGYDIIILISLFCYKSLKAKRDKITKSKKNKKTQSPTKKRKKSRNASKLSKSQRNSETITNEIQEFNLHDNLVQPEKETINIDSVRKLIDSVQINDQEQDFNSMKYLSKSERTAKQNTLQPSRSNPNKDHFSFEKHVTEKSHNIYSGNNQTKNDLLESKILQENPGQPNKKEVTFMFQDNQSIKKSSITENLIDTKSELMTSLLDSLLRQNKLLNTLNKRAPECLEKVFDKWTKTLQNFRFKIVISRSLEDMLITYEKFLWDHLSNREWNENVDAIQSMKQVSLGNKKNKSISENIYKTFYDPSILDKYFSKSPEPSFLEFHKRNRLVFLLCSYKVLNGSNLTQLSKKENIFGEEKEIVSMAPYLKINDFVHSFEFESMVKCFENLTYESQNFYGALEPTCLTNASYQNDLLKFLLSKKIITADLYLGYIKSCVKTRLNLLVKDFYDQIKKHTIRYEKTKIMMEKNVSIQNGIK